VDLKDESDDRKDQLAWKWGKGEATAPAAFMDPVNGSARYRLCVYDSSAMGSPLMQMELPPGGTCGRAPCWKAKGVVGFRYKNGDATPNGLTLAKLKSGESGKANIGVKGKGMNLPMPALALTLPVTVQLVIGDAATSECWETTYTVADRNDATRFSAQGP
jgi:hypothetical protein